MSAKCLGPMSHPASFGEEEASNAVRMDPFQGAQYLSTPYVPGVAPTSQSPGTMVSLGGGLVRSRSHEPPDQYNYQQGPTPAVNQQLMAAPSQPYGQQGFQVPAQSSGGCSEYVQQAYEPHTHLRPVQYLPSEHAAYQLPMAASPSDQQSPYYSGLVSDPDTIQAYYAAANSQHQAYPLQSSSTPDEGQMPEALSSSTDVLPPGEHDPTSTSPQSQVRVINTRPRPQCWEHGCNGREFSTISNLLRHQREKAGVAAKYECPYCDTVFTRATARNGHLARGKCSSRRQSA